MRKFLQLSITSKDQIASKQMPSCPSSLKLLLRKSRFLLGKTQIIQFMTNKLTCLPSTRCPMLPSTQQTICSSNVQWIHQNSRLHFLCSSKLRAMMKASKTHLIKQTKPCVIAPPRFMRGTQPQRQSFATHWSLRQSNGVTTPWDMLEMTDHRKQFPSFFTHQDSSVRFKLSAKLAMHTRDARTQAQVSGRLHLGLSPSFPLNKLPWTPQAHGRLQLQELARLLQMHAASSTPVPTSLN